MDLIDNNRKALVKILSAGIRGKRADFSVDDNIDWETVVIEAERHKLLTQIYFFTTIEYPEIRLPDYIKEELRKRCLLEISEQEKNIMAFGDILRKMVDSGLSVIILKGLFLRTDSS